MAVKVLSEKYFGNFAIAWKTLNQCQVSLVQQTAGDDRRAEPCLTHRLRQQRPAWKCLAVGIRECCVYVTIVPPGIAVLCGWKSRSFAAMLRELTYHFGVHTCLGIARPGYSGLLQMQGLQSVIPPHSPSGYRDILHA